MNASLGKVDFCYQVLFENPATHQKEYAAAVFEQYKAREFEAFENPHFYFVYLLK